MQGKAGGLHPLPVLCDCPTAEGMQRAGHQAGEVLARHWKTAKWQVDNMAIGNRK